MKTLAICLVMTAVAVALAVFVFRSSSDESSDVDTISPHISVPPIDPVPQQQQQQQPRNPRQLPQAANKSEAFPMPKFPPRVQSIQEKRWAAAEIRPQRQAEVRLIARKIERDEARYRGIGTKAGVAWWAVACLHNLECGLRFDRHLHNGDPLTARTKLVPKGRPPGSPPFTFEESAHDALQYDKMDRVKWEDLSDALDAFEGYNGWGYRKNHPDVPTPYLWSGTSIYFAGKYVADGKWSQTAVSKQIGVAAILKELGVFKS